MSDIVVKHSLYLIQALWCQQNFRVYAAVLCFQPSLVIDMVRTPEKRVRRAPAPSSTQKVSCKHWIFVYRGGAFFLDSWFDLAASQNVKPRSIPWSYRTIHTPDPYENTGDPERRIRLDHRGSIHTGILTQTHLIVAAMVVLKQSCRLGEVAGNCRKVVFLGSVTSLLVLFCFVGWLAGWLVVWLVCRLFGWSVGRSVGWLPRPFCLCVCARPVRKVIWTTAQVIGDSRWLLTLCAI